MWGIFAEGILLSAGLIIAIGAQNAYVLRQGVEGNHPFWVATVCFLCDFVLMSLGVLGVGTFLAENIWIQQILAGIGALYILFFAYQAFRSALNPEGLRAIPYIGRPSRMKVIAGALAITLLNPHVYLDTIVILGGFASTLQYEEKLIFLIGALIASFVWFYSLSFGASRLAPILSKPLTWRILNFLIALMMLYIAYQLGLFIWNTSAS